MLVYIDTHTHHLDSNNPFAVYNLTINEVDAFLKTDQNVFFSLGIHPWEVHLYDSGIFETIQKALSDPRMVAIGECGIDRNSKANIKEQLFFFERQIQLSEQYQKPLIIHCVASFNELMNLRKRLKPSQNWIIHGFRGKPELAAQLLKSGCALSFGENFNPKSVELTPLDRLCIETDESRKAIEDIYKEIAQIKGCLPTELNAACRLLNLYVC